MNFKKKILIIILLLGFVPLILASTEYTPSSETTCDLQGKCTFTQYSGIRYVQEDNQWKPYENARSLKDKGFGVQYIENDKNFPLEVLDFNVTSVSLKLDPDGIVFLSKEVPLRVWTEDKITPTEEKVYTGDFKQDYLKTKEDLINFDIFKQNEFLTLSANLGDIIEWGYNSTTIVLTADDTENMADSMIDSSSVSTNYGTTNSLQIGRSSSGHNRSAVMMWNISAIPSSVEINNASLLMTVSFNGIDAGESFDSQAFYVYQNFSWSEVDITWNKRPQEVVNYTRDLFSNLVVLDSSLDQGQNMTYNVTSLVQYAYSNSFKNISIYLQTVSLLSGTPATSDPIQYASKEYTTSDRQARLVIEYTDNSPPPSSSCNYSGSGLWSINCADNCTISTNYNLGQNSILFNNSGTFYSNADVTNFNLFSLSNSCKVVLGSGKRWG